MGALLLGYTIRNHRFGTFFLMTCFVVSMSCYSEITFRNHHTKGDEKGLEKLFPVQKNIRGPVKKYSLKNTKKFRTDFAFSKNPKAYYSALFSLKTIVFPLFEIVPGFTNLFFISTKDSRKSVFSVQKTKEANRIVEELLRQKRITFIEILIIISVVVAGVLIVFVIKLRKLNSQKIVLNRKLMLKNKRLKELNQGKNKLFSILSHDLRSPLGSMTQLLELIKDDDLAPKEQTELLDEMQLQLSATNLMLSNLLRWASAQFGGSRLTFKKVDLIEKVEKVIQVNHLVAKLKSIKIKHCLHHENWSVHVDEDHLQLILNNLISNALKYTPPQKNIEITYAREGNDICLKILNEGAPISQEKIEEIRKFDLKLVSEPGTTNELGTGLGLLLTKQCLKKNHAKLKIRGIPNKGSEFKICFEEHKM